MIEASTSFHVEVLKETLKASWLHYLASAVQLYIVYEHTRPLEYCTGTDRLSKPSICARSQPHNLKA